MLLFYFLNKLFFLFLQSFHYTAFPTMFLFYLFATLVFSVCFHLWVCLLFSLLSFFVSSLYSFFFFLLFVSVSLWASSCIPFWLMLLFLSRGFSVFLFVCLYFLFYFSLLCCVACEVLVLQQGIRPEPLRWETWVQEKGTPENSQPHGILMNKSSPSQH